MNRGSENKLKKAAAYLACGYTLDMYCANKEVEWIGSQDKRMPGQHRYQEFPHTFFDERGSVCRTQAKAAGWKADFKRGVALCPSCVKAGLKVKDFG